jgi:hypothetical protein
MIPSGQFFRGRVSNGSLGNMGKTTRCLVDLDKERMKVNV